MRELAPTAWLTALRKVQNPNRAGSQTSFPRTRIFNTLKVNPVFYWSDADMENYLKAARPSERVGLFRSRQGRRKTRSAVCTQVGARTPWFHPGLAFDG